MELELETLAGPSSTWWAAAGAQLLPLLEPVGPVGGCHFKNEETLVRVYRERSHCLKGLWRK